MSVRPKTVTAIWVILVAMTALVAFCSHAQAHAQTPDVAGALGSAIRSQSRGIARSYARVLIRELKSTPQADPVNVRVSSIDLVIEPAILMPPTPDQEYTQTRVIAHTTVSADEEVDGGCTIHVVPEYRLDRMVLAHEVCHCVMEQGIIGEHGYKKGVSLMDRQLGERNAWECAAILVHGSLVQ